MTCNTLHKDSITQKIKTALNRAVYSKKHDLSVNVIAAHLTDLTGLKISGNTIHNWTAHARTESLPRPEILAHLCNLLDDIELLQVILEPVSDRFVLIDKETANLLTISEYQQKLEELKKEIIQEHKEKEVEQ